MSDVRVYVKEFEEKPMVNIVSIGDVKYLDVNGEILGRSTKWRMLESEHSIVVQSNKGHLVYVCKF